MAENRTIRRLKERKQRQDLHDQARSRAVGVRRYLERGVWPQVPTCMIGKRLTKAQENAILGYGRDGV